MNSADDIGVAGDSHARKLNRLEAVGVLATAGGIFLLVHPAWSCPISSTLIIAMLAFVAVGKWFSWHWIDGWRANIGFLALMIWVLEANVGNVPVWMRLIVFAVMLSFAGSWTHRRWRLRAAAPPVLHVDPLDENHFTSWDGEQDLRARSPAAPAWTYALRPRSRTVMLHALAWLLTGLAIGVFILEAQLPHYAVLLTVPEFVLAVGLWFHQPWIRWLGMLVCLGWAGLIAWAVFQANLVDVHLAIAGAIVFTLVRTALSFRTWYFEYKLDPSPQVRYSEPAG